MIQAKPKFESFEEYLAYDDGTEKLYELFNGGLVELPVEPGSNVVICNLLFLSFAQQVNLRCIRPYGLELEVRGEPRNRYPDLTVIREEHVEQLRRRNTLRFEMAPPLLVVEIVSPGELQRDRDYIAKRMQYQDRGIPEYWIVDSQLQTLLVLELSSGIYTEVVTLQGEDQMRSPQFGELNLTVSQLFTVGQ